MGVVLGQSRQHTGDSRPSRKTGFTLVELLVVMAIIVTLASILMPALANAWESSKRAKCASNLRNVGAAALAFAGRHNGYFPMCYRMRDTASVGYPYYVPFAISQGGASGTPDLFSNDANDNYWPTFGTSWQEWQACGANLGVFSCPSTRGDGAYAVDLTSTNPEYGAVIWTDYMYVGGLSDYTNSVSLQPAGTLNIYAPLMTSYKMHSVGNWGRATPAVLTKDVGADQLGHDSNWAKAHPTQVTGDPTLSVVQSISYVLAADTVFYSGGPGYAWDLGGQTRYRINHPRRGYYTDPSNGQVVTGTLPEFQNVLYSDGSVRSHGMEDFMQPLNIDAIGQHGTGNWWDTGPNWSMLMANTAGIGGYLYWGEGEAVPLPVGATPAPTTNPQGGPGPAPIPPPPLMAPAGIPKPPPTPPGAGPQNPVFRH